MEIALKHGQEVGFCNSFCKISGMTEIFFLYVVKALNTVDMVSLEDTMADTNFVVERKNVEAEKSSTEELKFNSDSGWQESEWIRKIRSGLEMARSCPNVGGDVPIKRLPASYSSLWNITLHENGNSASTTVTLKHPAVNQKL